MARCGPVPPPKKSDINSKHSIDKKMINIYNIIYWKRMLLALGNGRVTYTRIILLLLAIINSGENIKHNCLGYWRATKSRQYDLWNRGNELGEIQSFLSFLFGAISSPCSIWDLELNHKEVLCSSKKSEFRAHRAARNWRKKFCQGSTYRWEQVFKSAHKLPSDSPNYTNEKQEYSVYSGNQVQEGWKSWAEISTSASFWGDQIWYSTPTKLRRLREHLELLIKTPEGPQLKKKNHIPELRLKPK